LAFCNQKGGVGKTTVAVHAVFYAERIGKRVCFIDLDAQANGTVALLEDRPNGPEGASRLFREPVDPQRVNDQISVIPADPFLNDCEKLSLKQVYPFRDNLAPLRDGFDYLVIDTPPTLGNRLVAALLAADYAVAPIAPVSFALQGISDLMTTINRIRRDNPNLRFLGMMLNKVNTRSSTQQSAIQTLREQLGDYTLPCTVAERAAISDAVDNGHPVWRYAQGESARRGALEMFHAMRTIYKRMDGGDNHG